MKTLALQVSDRPSEPKAIARFFSPLALVLVLAACLRLYNLVPLARGLQFPQDYDEAVWDTTAQLMLQGYLPYRDFFATLPPVGIYLLAGVLRIANAPWGNAVGFMATRYASVFYGLATIAVVYLIGCKLAGWPTGLAAAGLLAVDGMVIAVDRRALLEPPLNLLSAVTMLAYLSIFEHTSNDVQSKGMHLLTGFFSAVAALAKTPGFVVVFAVVSVSLLRRRFLETALILIGFTVGWVALSAYFLLQCPEDFIKQVYFFQFLRPPDGIIRWTSRLYHIWSYTVSWSTVRIGLMGALVLALVLVVRRGARPWLVIFAWVGYTLVLILFTSSYWPQYYVQLAVPLALLAGGLLNKQICGSVGGRTQSLALGALTFTVIVLIGLACGAVPNQFAHIMRMLGETNSTYMEVAEFLSQNTLPQSMVLAFEPNYTFLSSRPLAGVRPGHFLVDSYGEMLYVNLGIREDSLLALINAMLTGQKEKLQLMFWRAPAQEVVLAAFDRAEYIIVDGRARYQLEPQTLATICARSTEMFAYGVASLRKRQ
ncbi:MAG: phospholipid carrier-dependent glycosyltransferase [Anaerolineae bacterium]